MQIDVGVGEIVYYEMYNRLCTRNLCGLMFEVVHEMFVDAQCLHFL